MVEHLECFLGFYHLVDNDDDLHFHHHHHQPTVYTLIDLEQFKNSV